MERPRDAAALAAPRWPFSPRFSWKRFKSEDAPKIHVALSVSLFLVNLAFFIGVGHGSNGTHAACVARGAIFHYFLLCVFTWMVLEAFHLYLLVIKVFNTYFGHYFLKLSLVGWGRCGRAGQRGWLGGVRPSNALPPPPPRPASPHGHRHLECQQLWPLHHPRQGQQDHTGAVSGGCGSSSDPGSLAAHMEARGRWGEERPRKSKQRILLSAEVN